MTEPAPGQTTVVEQTGARLHPLTPFVKGWGYFVVAAFALVNNEGLRSNLSSPASVWPPYSSAASCSAPLSWCFTKWQLTDDAIRVDSGFLFRRTRIIRFDRIQAIDVAQPFVARLFGMAELRMDVAGGGKSDGKLSYFRYDEAVELRDDPAGPGQGRARRRAAGTAGGAGAAPGRLRRPACSVRPCCRPQSSRVRGAVIWLIVATMVLDFHIGLFAALPLLLGVVQPIWKQVVGNHGFTLSE